MAGASPVKLPSHESHWTVVMRSQYWYQAITRTNVDPDLCHCMESLGPANELIGFADDLAHGFQS